MHSYKEDGLGALRTAPDCGHRAPLNWLGLPSSMICGHVERSSGSTYGRSHYCPYWEPFHFHRPCSPRLKNESGTSFKQLQDARTSLYYVLQMARAPFGTGKRVSGTRAMKLACRINTPRQAQHADHARIRRAPDLQQRLTLQSHSFPRGKRETERGSRASLVCLICVE